MSRIARQSRNKELLDLGLRVYRNEMITEKDKDGKVINKDEQAILDIVNKTFGKGNPSPENLFLFNQFLIETTEVILEPKVDELLGLLADFKAVDRGTVVIYNTPKTVNPKWKYTAKGTGVDLVRISPDETKVPALPTSIEYGGYYETTTFLADPIGAFNDAVNKLAEAELNLYFEKITELMATAITNAKIPANNVKQGSNLAITKFQELENTMIRLGKGRPVFFADIALINAFANQQLTTATMVTDELRNSLREELIPSMISKTIAIPFQNDYIDEANGKVKFDVEAGYMFPANGKKPFAITKYGIPRQVGEFDPITEQVKLKIVLESDITLLNGRYIGYISDDGITV